MRLFLLPLFATLILAGCSSSESVPTAGDSMSSEMQKAQTQAEKESGNAPARKAGRMNNRAPADGATAPAPPPGTVGG